MLEFGQWGLDHRGWVRTTREGYVTTLHCCAAHIRGEKARRLVRASTRDLEGFLFSLVVGPRTRNKHRQALIAFFDFATDQGYRLDNPALKLPRLPEPRLLPKALEPEDCTLLLKEAQAIGGETWAATSGLFYSGMRNGEIRPLGWHMIERHHIRVIGKGRGGGKEREIPLHPVFKQALDAIRGNDPRWVFPSPPGPRHTDGPMSRSKFVNLLKEVGDAVGIDIYPHLCRHSFATRVLDESDNIRVVQELLGHASLSSTEIYTLIRNRKKDNAVFTLDYGRELGDAG